MAILEDKGDPIDKKGREREREKQVGGMTYKPIELRPLGPLTLRAENQEENVGEWCFKRVKKYFTQQGLSLVFVSGVNGLNRRHRRRVPLSVWVAVALLVLVLFGCIATIAYVNLSADAHGEEKISLIKGSWAIVLGGRGDTFNRHIEVQTHCEYVV